jgi:uncharacterized protein (DUF433 family)
MLTGHLCFGCGWKPRYGMTSKGNHKKTKKPRPRFMGRYIVTDPDICHGKPTFRGTRILVAHVLEQVADGTAWETIIQEWHGSLTKEAIAEAVRLASQAFLEHSQEYTAPEYVLQRVAA